MRESAGVWRCVAARIGEDAFCAAVMDVATAAEYDLSHPMTLKRKASDL